MKEQKVHRRMKIAIITLSVLLALSVSMLVGVLLYHASDGKWGVPAIAPDNVIKSDELTAYTAAGGGARLARTGRATSFRTDVSPPLLSGTATGIGPSGGTVIELYKNRAQENEPFAVQNMFPGDREEKTYRVKVSYTGAVTVHFRAEIRAGYEKLAEVLNCTVGLRETGEVLYDGLMRDMGQLDYLLASLSRGTEELSYVITAYLDTGVGNDYQDRQLIADFIWWVEGDGAPVTPPGEGETTPGPELVTGDHFSYIHGRDDGRVYPQDPISRAEVVTIYYRLITDETRARFQGQVSPYYDVRPEAWYNNAIATMTRAGIIRGRGGNVFDPEAPITRAEFAAMAARFFRQEGGEEAEEDLFPDIRDHWARNAINAATKMGFILGYEDGTFRPNQYITRAEAMAIFNRVLGRRPHKDHLLPDMKVWADNMDITAWYYAEVQEATNSHDYVMSPDGAYEIWTELFPFLNWSWLERSLTDENGALIVDPPIPVQISAENRPIAMVAVEDGGKPAISVELDKREVEALAAAGRSLEVRLDRFSVTFSSVALSAIAEQAREDAITVALRMVPGAELSQTQQDALRVFDLHSLLSIAVISGGEIHDFRGGRATVRVPLTLTGSLDAGKMTVLYVADNGELERVPFTCENGVMEFSVGHFSQYAIAGDELGAAQITGHLVYPPRVYLQIGLPCAALALLAVTWAYLRRKRERHEA